MKKLLILTAVILLLSATVAHADTLTLPSSLTIIEEEAFYGDESLDVVVLPEGITEIKAGAFKASSVSSINLPTTITSIADDALPAPGTVEVTAVEGTWAYNWAVEKGYIIVGESPLDDFVIENGVVVKYVGPGGDVVIPSKDGEGNTVFKIGNQAFMDCVDLRSIRIPSSIISIESHPDAGFGYGAFSSCINLTVVALPEGLTDLGDGAFQSCVCLSHVDIPESVTFIGEQAFHRCSTLKKCTMADGVRKIGRFAFGYCTNLESIEIGDNTTVSLDSTIGGSIEYGAFWGCNSLTGFDIPRGFKRIGEYAFHDCTALKSIGIPDSITDIDSWAFDGCSGLTDVAIPDGLNHIGVNAFELCWNIRFFASFDSDGAKALGKADESFRVPGTGYDLKYLYRDDVNIGLEILNADASLVDLIIIDGVTHIGDNAFNDCTSLNNVFIPNGVIEIGESAFCNCIALASITLPESVLEIGDNAFYMCESLNNVALPRGLEHIGTNAFCFCGNLKSLVIPDDISYLGYFAFDHDIALYCDVGSSASRLLSKDGYVFRTQGINCALKYLFTDDSVSGLELYSVDKDVYDFTIPGYVSDIDLGAFCGCYNLKTVSIPEGISNVGSFNGCTSLTDISIPNGVTSIGSFDDCINLQSIEIPNGVVSIGSFENCVCLTSIVLPEGIIDICDHAFFNCKNLATLTIPQSVTSIGAYAFYSCAALESIMLPDGLESIDKAALVEYYGTVCAHVGSKGAKVFGKHTTGIFRDPAYPALVLWYDCSNEDDPELKVYSVDSEAVSIIIPDGLKTIEGSTFIYNKNLQHIDIPESVVQISEMAFAGLTSLTEISLPNGIQDIGDGIFMGCSNLRSVALPNRLTSISASMFSGCVNLETLEIPKSVNAIGVHAFEDCKKLVGITIPEGVTSIEESTFSGCTALSNILLPESLAAIGAFSFNGCSSLEEIVLPNDVNLIEPFAFSDSGLKTIHIPATITDGLDDALQYTELETVYAMVYSYAFEWAMEKDYLDVQPYGSFSDVWADYEIEDGCIVSYHGDRHALFIPAEDSKGNSITKIDDSAFAYDSNLNWVMIADGIEEIGDCAFSNCDSLTRIIMPESLTRIGNGAFHECYRLYNTSIPKGVTMIGESAFYNCGLKDVTLPSGITQIGNSTFYGNDFSSISIPEGVKEIGPCAFCKCGYLVSVKMSDNITNIGSAAFSRTAIKSIRIPAGVSSIEDSTFMYCPNLETVTIPDGLITIEESAFYRCYSLKDVAIPNSVTEIERLAFTQCSNITEIRLPEHLERIGDYAFDGCKGLTEIVIPDGVKTIGDSAFSECTGLTEITIPENVEELGSYCFSGCSSLTHITIPGGVSSLYAVFCDCSGLTSVIITDGLTSIYDAFTGCSNLKSITIPGSVSWINADTFQDASDITAVVELGSYAQQYCIDNNIPYTTYSRYTLTLRSAAFWDYDKALNPVPLHVTALAKGGIKPYQFRYTLLKDGETVRTTAWANSWYGYSDYYFYPENPREGQYSVVVEVEDSIGLTIVSDPCDAEAFDEGSYDQAKLRRTFLALVEEAPVATDFDSVFFNDNMENVSWLPTALNILETDMSLLRSQGAKQKYLFDQAFKASANGSVINTIDEFSVPKAMKALGLSINVEEESYYNGLFSMFDRYNIAYSSSDKNTYISLFKDYHAGIIDDNDLTNRFGGVFAENDMTAVKDSFHAVSLIKTVNSALKGVDVGSAVVNGTFDIYNQLQLLSAMDRDCVRKIIKIYNAMDDTAYTLAASRLTAIVNASSLEDKIALIVYGELGDVGIDLILKEVKLASKVNAIGIAKSVVNFVTGANSYADAMNKLMWACEITKAAERDFNSACARYKLSDTEEYFMDLVNCYSNYMEMAASAEEAYVGVVKWQQSTPLSAVESFFFGTNDYLEGSKNHCQEKATALRCLSESVRQVKNLYKNAGYAQAAAWLKNCRVDQTKLKDIGVYHYDDSSGGGGGGGGF